MRPRRCCLSFRQQVLETVDKLTERIGTLESILDVDHPDWRQKMKRPERDKE